MTRANSRFDRSAHLPRLSYLGVALTLVMTACGSASVTRAPLDARAAGGSPNYRPVSLRELAYGKSGSPKAGPGAVHGAASSSAELDAFLAPTPKTNKTRVAPVAMRARTAPTPAPARIVLSQPAATPVIALNEPRHELSGPAANPDEARNYAAREARSQPQQQYRGGDVLVITASTLVIVLLIVLLVVLLLR